MEYRNNKRLYKTGVALTFLLLLIRTQYAVDRVPAEPPECIYLYIAMYSPWASISSSHMLRMSSIFSSAAVWGSSIAAW